MELLSLLATIPLAVVLSLGSFTLTKEFIDFEDYEDTSDRLVLLPAVLFYIFFAGLFWFASFHIITH